MNLKTRILLIVLLSILAICSQVVFGQTMKTEKAFPAPQSYIYQNSRN